MSAPEAWHVTRTLRAMELLAVRPRSAPELADALGVHVRTARRVLKRLDSEGYVTLSDERRRRYRPDDAGGRARRAGRGARRAAGQPPLPHVTALREQLGEGCHLCVPSHLFALCLVHDAGRGSARLPPAPARACALPLHRGRQGAARLARGVARGGARAAARSFTERTSVGPGVAPPRAGADRRARLRGRGPRVPARHARPRGAGVLRDRRGGCRPRRGGAGRAAARPIATARWAPR